MKTLNPTTLKIEMIDDIVCSYCPIGCNNINAAINNLKIDVDFLLLPFELNSNMTETSDLIARYFSRRKGWNEDKLPDYQKSLVTTATIAGVNVGFSKRPHYHPTRNAHLLMHRAEQLNKQTQLNERLIKAYFKEDQDISNLIVLLNIAQVLDLDRLKANAALISTELSYELNKKTARYKTFKFSSIPALILNENALISG